MILAEQMELAPRRTVPKVAPTDARIGELIEHLRDKGWVKGPAICAALEWDDRPFRKIKASCCGLVISNSEDGYKLLMEATIEEVDHAVNDRRSRIRKLQQDIIDIEAAFHSRRTQLKGATI